MILSSQLKEHLKGTRAFYVGTRDKDFTCDIVRVLGAIVTGHDSIKFFIAVKTAKNTLDNLRANKIVSLSATNIFTSESFQLKGRMIVVKDANQEEDQFIKDYIYLFDEAVAKFGLPEGLVTKSVPYHPALTVEFTVVQVFDQTPKIGTGKLVSAI